MNAGRDEPYCYVPALSNDTVLTLACYQRVVWYLKKALARSTAHTVVINVDLPNPQAHTKVYRHTGTHTPHTDGHTRAHTYAQIQEHRHMNAHACTHIHVEKVGRWCFTNSTLDQFVAFYLGMVIVW